MLNSHTPTLDDRQHYAQGPAPLRYKLSYMGEPITADGDPATPAALLPRVLPMPMRIQQKLIATRLAFCPSACIADALRLPDTDDTEVDALSLNAAATPLSASPAAAALSPAAPSLHGEPSCLRHHRQANFPLERALSASITARKARRKELLQRRDAWPR
jgi:hypothetical protein